MDATDPRISGMFTQVMGVRSFPIDPGADIWALAWTATVRIENADGAWAGTFEGFNNETIPLEWYHLTGEGAYEGLTATMRWTGDSDSYEGIIIPGVPPDYPEPTAATGAGTTDEAATGSDVAADASDSEAEAEATGTIWSRVERSVVYGDDDPAYQRLHIYMPEPRENPRPALIWFHGGGLEVGINVDDTLEFGQLAAGGALGEPYVTFLAGYRLLNPRTGEVRWPAQLDDAQRIVRWVRAHAYEYSVDPHRICSAGDSSGGHLAAILGALETRDDSDPELAGISSRVDCAITIAGVVDMSLPLYEWARGEWYEAIAEAEIAADPSLAFDASVVHRVDEDTVPMLILHGNRDDVVPIEQSRNLAEALAAAGIEYAYAELPAGHGYYGILQEQGTLELMKAFPNYQVHPER